MKIFLSWSGATSHAIALRLQSLLEHSVPGHHYFISDKMPSGSLWRSLLAEELSDSYFGVVCLTPDNCRSHWLHFEAGAVAKTVGKSRLVPYLFHLAPGDVEGPLADFQMVQADADGTHLLAQQIGALRPFHNDSVVSRLFQLLWPDFGSFLKSLDASPPETTVPRSDESKLDEVLQRIRRLESNPVSITLPKGSSIVGTPWPLEGENLARLNSARSLAARAAARLGEITTEPDREAVATQLTALEQRIQLYAYGELGYVILEAASEKLIEALQRAGIHLKSDT